MTTETIDTTKSQPAYPQPPSLDELLAKATQSSPARGPRLMPALQRETEGVDEIEGGDGETRFDIPKFIAEQATPMASRAVQNVEYGEQRLSDLTTRIVALHAHLIGDAGDTPKYQPPVRVHGRPLAQVIQEAAHTAEAEAALASRLLDEIEQFFVA